MPKQQSIVLVLILLSSLAIVVPAQVALSSGTPLLTTSLTAGQPVQTTFQGQQAVAINYTDNIDTTLNVIVYLSVQNSIGQTVGIILSPISGISNGQTVPAYLIVFGLAPGQYTGTVFAVTFAGVPISTTSTLQLTLK